MSIFEKYDLHQVDESFEIPENPETGLTPLVKAMKQSLETLTGFVTDMNT